MVSVPVEKSKVHWTTHYIHYESYKLQWLGNVEKNGESLDHTYINTSDRKDKTKEQIRAKMKRQHGRRPKRRLYTDYTDRGKKTAYVFIFLPYKW